MIARIHLLRHHTAGLQSVYVNASILITLMIRFEYLIIFTGRRFITKSSKLEFLDDVLKMVKRAEEVQEVTVEIYEELLD